MPRRGSELPDDIRRAVLREIYLQADDMGWDGFSSSQRTTQYNRWLDAPTVGGRLTQFMSRERARVWMKDVPMKEFARAQAGVGPYSRFVRRRTPGPAALVKQVLGEGWEIVPGSVEEKPNRCQARCMQEPVTKPLMWGPPSSMRDLVWAGLLARADGAERPLIVVTSRRGEVLSASEEQRHRSVAALAGLEVVHIVQRLVRNPDYEAEEGGRS